MAEVNTILTLMTGDISFTPRVKGWHRLEGRPRHADFERSLRAEVRDPLWFLTRQWQFGEFRGEDAGSPVDAAVVIRQSEFQHYASGQQAAVAYDKTVPLETTVEREPIPADLITHIQVSRHFFGVLGNHPQLRMFKSLYLAAYPLTANAVRGFIDERTRQVLLLAQSRAFDGATLIAEIDSGQHAVRVDGFAGASAADRDDLNAAATALRAWYERLYSVPTQNVNSAWAPSFLEYQFACASESAGDRQSVLRAESYTQGRLDWHAFEVDPRAPLRRSTDDVFVPPPATEERVSFLPAPVSFPGMPSHRYWEMEDRRIEFAQIDAHTTDIAKLVLTEFALLYGNDWCVVPYEVAIGSLCEVMGLLVTDAFGEQVLIRAAGKGVDDDWQRWGMFNLTTIGSGDQADPRLLVPPALGAAMQGPPLEKIVWLRDEMANMVWAVESIIPSGLGTGIDGHLPARAAAPPPSSPPPAAAVRYALGTDVPHNWRPFVPVHVPGSTRSVQLQRARLPGSERPLRGEILSVSSPYYVHEEEVPRSGAIVTRAYQRARWLGGKTFVWIGRRVTTGRGEGASGLAFDQIRDTPLP